MSRILGAPLLHFLVLGCALHVAGPWWQEHFGPRPVIVVTAGQQASLRAGFEQQFGRPPSASERAKLVGKAVEEELLFRNAIELGLDRRNAFVDYRLATLASFLEPGMDHEDRSLVEDARALGLDRTDLVIRRHLVETLRVLYRRRPPGEPAPGEDEIEAVYRREAKQLQRPPRVAFSHVYFSRDRRGRSAEGAAREALARIRDGKLDPGAARKLGDPFLPGTEFVLASQSELESRIGQELTAGITAAPAGEWTGPLPSAWGLHLVLVRAREPGGIPPLAEVRERVLGLIESERAEQRLRERLASLRKRYEVRIAEDAG